MFCVPIRVLFWHVRYYTGDPRIPGWCLCILETCLLNRTTALGVSGFFTTQRHRRAHAQCTRSRIFVPRGPPKLANQGPSTCARTGASCDAWDRARAKTSTRKRPEWRIVPRRSKRSPMAVRRSWLVASDLCSMRLGQAWARCGVGRSDDLHARPGTHTTRHSVEYLIEATQARARAGTAMRGPPPQLQHAIESESRIGRSIGRPPDVRSSILLPCMRMHGVRRHIGLDLDSPRRRSHALERNQMAVNV